MVLRLLSKLKLILIRTGGGFRPKKVLNLRALLAFLVGAICSISTEAAKKPFSEFEMNEIRHWYMEGDFDKAIRMLNERLNSKAPMERKDSIFIYKHLGVMYSAEYETREKGKWAFHRLLTVDTAAKITDMYASDMIYAIFKTVSEEAEAARLEKGSQDTAHGVPVTEPIVQSARHESKSSGRTGNKRNGATYFWVGAGAAVALGAGVTGYMMLSDSKIIAGEDFPVR